MLMRGDRLPRARLTPSLFSISSSPQEEKEFRDAYARDPTLREAYAACASLLMPREELEECMSPAADGPLSAGDAVILLGEEIHGAPGTANKQHRAVFFISGVLPGCAAARGCPPAAHLPAPDLTKPALTQRAEPRTDPFRCDFPPVVSAGATRTRWTSRRRPGPSRSLRAPRASSSRCSSAGEQRSTPAALLVPCAASCARVTALCVPTLRCALRLGSFADVGPAADRSAGGI